MKLRPYQVEAAHWLVGQKRAYLADAPRVGKTPSTAYALQLAKATGVLVMCPAGVRTHWRNTLREVAPNVPAEVMSYDKVVRGGEPLRDALFAHTDVSHLVLDEGHHLSAAASDKAEYPSSQRVKLILGRNGYVSRVPFVWILSGTPMRRDVGSMWPVMASMFGGKLKALGITTANDWYNRYTDYEWVAQQYGAPKRKVWRNKEENKGELAALLQSIMLRRTLDDIGMQVPPISWVPLTLDVDDAEMPKQSLGPAEMMGVARMVREWIDGKADIDEETPALSVLRHELGLAKVPGVVNHALETVLGDEQIVLYAHHLDVLDQLEAELRKAGVSVERVDGSTPEKARWRRFDLFNAGKASVFLGQNHAVKEGVPLHAANTAVLIEPDWSATVNHQLSMRIVAVGQTTPKIIQFATTANSIDEAISRQHIRETEMQEVI